MSESTTPNVHVTVDQSHPQPASELVPFQKLKEAGAGAGLVSARMVTEVTPEMLATKMAAEVEKAIRIQLAKEREVLKALDKECSKLHRERQDYLRDAPKRLLEGRSAEIETALAGFGFSADADYDPASFDTVNKKLSVTMRLDVSGDRGSSASVRKTYSFDAPEPLVTLQKLIETSERNLEDQQKVVRSTNSALLNINSIEREAKAKVITTIMEQSPDGQQLLGAFESIDVSEAVKYLQSM